MKILLILLFLSFMGVISAYFGVYVTKEPIKYFLINFPAIALFAIAINSK